MKSRNSTETKTFEIAMEVLISFILRSLVRFRDRFNRRTTAYSHSISVHHAFHWLGNEHECNHVFFYCYCVKFHSFMAKEEKKTWHEFIFQRIFTLNWILTLKQTEPGSSNSNNTCQITLRPLKFTANVCVCVCDSEYISNENNHKKFVDNEFLCSNFSPSQLSRQSNMCVIALILQSIKWDQSQRCEFGGKW